MEMLINRKCHPIPSEKAIKYINAIKKRNLKIENNKILDLDDNKVYWSIFDLYSRTDEDIIDLFKLLGDEFIKYDDSFNRSYSTKELFNLELINIPDNITLVEEFNECGYDTLKYYKYSIVEDSFNNMPKEELNIMKSKLDTKDFLNYILKEYPNIIKTEEVYI